MVPGDQGKQAWKRKTEWLESLEHVRQLNVQNVYQQFYLRSNLC